MENQTQSGQVSTAYCSTNDTVLQRLNYLGTILGKIKRKSEGIRLLLRRVEEIKDKRRRGHDLIPAMIELFAGLDGAYEAQSEARNRLALGKAIAIALDIMKKLEAKPLPAEKGRKFDCKIHRAVEAQTLNLPDQTILDVVFRGFKVGQRVYPAHVIVVKNAGHKNVGRESSQERSAKSKLNIPSDREYRDYVRDCFAELGDDLVAVDWLVQNHRQLLEVFAIDFDAIVPRIEQLYSPDKRGHPPCNPIAIIRSLLLMAEFQETGIPGWVARMRTSPLLAITCGFKPSVVPSVGTYYNLYKRLENGPYRPKCEHRILPSETRQSRPRYRMPREKPKEKEKRAQPPEKDVLKKLTAQLAAEGKEPIPEDLEKILNEILHETAVKKSAARKLLGDITKLTVCADGSTMESGADANGKPACDCRSKGIYKCEHVRKISDLDGAWGWNNRKKDWVFGYRYYQFVSPQKKHDLPLYLNFAPANAHEAVMSLKALERWRKQNEQLMPQLKLKRLSVDAIHDAYAYYRYLLGRQIDYAIPYAKQPPKSQGWQGSEQMVNANGIPICSGGLPMRRIGRHRNGYYVYSCPIKRPTNRKEGRNIRLIHRDECPRGALCEPQSRWGPHVKIKPEDDPRIHPTIPRTSREYRELRDLRSSCERSNSMKKVRYNSNSKYSRSRVMPYVFIRVALVSILEHSRVWVDDDLKNIKVTRENVRALFT